LDHNLRPSDVEKEEQHQWAVRVLHWQYYLCGGVAAEKDIPTKIKYSYIALQFLYCGRKLPGLLENSFISTHNPESLYE